MEKKNPKENTVLFLSLDVVTCTFYTWNCGRHLATAWGWNQCERWQSRDVEGTWAPDDNQLILESFHLDFLLPYCLSQFLFHCDKVIFFVENTVGCLFSIFYPFLHYYENLTFFSFLFPPIEERAIYSAENVFSSDFFSARDDSNSSYWDINEKFRVGPCGNLFNRNRFFPPSKLFIIFRMIGNMCWIME